MKVAIGTRNFKKVSAVRSAIKYMNMKCDEYMRIDVESNVPKQPFEDDVYQGAINRVLNMKKLNLNCDMYIGIEGGIVCQFGQYFNVQVSYILTRDGKKSFGISSALPVPKGYIEEIRKTSFSKVVGKKISGGTGVLTNGYINREKLIQESVVMALTSILNLSWSEDAEL